MTLPTRTLGPYQVSAIGLGAMPLSFGGQDPVSPEQAIATVHAALDAGVTYIDTADIYAPSWDTMGHNERLVARALKAYGPHEGVIVGTKGGITRSEGEVWGRDGSPAYLRKAVEASLRALDVDVIDLYQWHRPDRWRLYSEVVETFADLRREGKIKAIGISNANVEEIEVAMTVLGEGGLASVQNEFSPRFRCSATNCSTATSTGSRSWPGARWVGRTAARRHWAPSSPPSPEIAADHGVSPQQIALAWELAQSPAMIPIPGARRVESVRDSVRALDIELSTDEIARLDKRTLGRRPSAGAPPAATHGAVRAAPAGATAGSPACRRAAGGGVPTPIGRPVAPPPAAAVWPAAHRASPTASGRSAGPRRWRPPPNQDDRRSARTAPRTGRGRRPAGAPRAPRRTADAPGSAHRGAQADAPIGCRNRSRRRRAAPGGGPTPDQRSCRPS